MPTRSEARELALTGSPGRAHSGVMLTTRDSIRTIQLALAAAAIALLSACGGAASRSEPDNSQGNRIERIEIAYFRNGCSGEPDAMCLQERLPDGRFANFFDPIEGFAFEWGYRYVLDVERTTVNNPPADASQYRYRLLTQVSKQAASDIPEVDLWIPDLGLQLAREADGLFTFNDGTLLRCDSDDCDSLDALIDQRFAARVVLAFGATPGAPLQLLRIRCGDSPESFFASCL